MSSNLPDGCNEMMIPGNRPGDYDYAPGWDDADDEREEIIASFIDADIDPATAVDVAHLAITIAVRSRLHGLPATWDLEALGGKLVLSTGAINREEVVTQCSRSASSTSSGSSEGSRAWGRARSWILLCDLVPLLVIAAFYIGLILVFHSVAN